MAVTINGDGVVDVGGNASSAAYVRLYEDSDNGTNYVDLIAPASVASNRTLTMPDASGVIDRLNRAGNVLQVINVQSGTVASTSSNIPLDNTIPQNTEGAELFTATITPTQTSSKLLIQVIVQIAPTSSAWTGVALFQDSTVNAIASSASYMTTGTGAMVMSINHYMTAGTTASTTFKVRYGSNSGNTTVNGSAGGGLYGGTLASSITIMEIAG